MKGSPQLPFDVAKIRWRQAQGKNGPFELSEDNGNPEHKALLKFLVELAGERVVSEGFYYWIFQDGITIGRKKSKR
jgi:hypothetical protein